MKDRLLLELEQALPESLRELRGIPFGQMTAVSIPTNEAESIVVMGDISAQLFNAIFVPLQGISVVDALLYLGSLNPVNIASLVVGLEAGGGEVSSLLVIEYPLEGEVFHAAPDTLTVSVLVLIENADALISLEGTIESQHQNSEVVAFTEGTNTGEYTADILIPLTADLDQWAQNMDLLYSLTITGIFSLPDADDDITEQANVSFQLLGPL